MDWSAIESLRAGVSQITDVRVVGRGVHRLIDVLGITLLAVLCGADDFVAGETFAVGRRVWRQQFFEWPNGVPAHDTFRRVLGLIDPKQLSASLVGWTAALPQTLTGRVLALDGQTARGSASQKKGLRALHLVSAWATEEGLTLGQVAVEEKSKEITALPELRELLSRKGALVTIDARGMPTAIVAPIRQPQADFVIGRKDNQPTLAADRSQLLDEGCRTRFAELTTDVHTTTEQAHGGTEQRDVRVIGIPKESPHRPTWKDLRTLAVVLKRIERDGLESFETRF